MGLNKFRIGRLIKAYKQECGISNLTAAQVSGINAGKEFFEPAKQVGQDTSNYKVVPSGYYACNLMHVGRDMVLPVALNRTTGNKIVSPAYTVFQLVATEMVHPVYLFMLFNSKERDRYFWFHTDGSVRDGMSWDDFCDCEIDVPPIEIQRKYVAIYEAMLTNQRAYEQGLDDLKLAIDALFDNFKKFDTSCLVSNLLYEVNERNSMGLKAKTMGISLDHIFIPSRAEIDNPKKYKLVMPGQIACNLIHVGRDGAYPIAQNTSDDALLVSPDYHVFNCKSPAFASYVMGWFSRTEVGRYGWFICDTDIRGRLNIDKFLNLEIPLPAEELVCATAKLRSSYHSRFAINNRLKAQLKEICPILVRGAIEEASR